jgi:hypothetical protein
MPDDADAQILQVVRRQVRQDRLVDVVLAERSLVLSKAKAPQPDHDVHNEAQAPPWSISSSERAGEVPGGKRRAGSVPVRTWVRTRRMRAPFKAAWIIPDHPAGLFSCWLFSGKASAGYFVPIHRGCFVPLTTHRTWCLVPRGNLNSAKQCHPG